MFPRHLLPVSEFGGRVGRVALALALRLPLTFELSLTLGQPGIAFTRSGHSTIRRSGVSCVSAHYIS
jgi:hypothetical protein